MYLIEAAGFSCMGGDKGLPEKEDIPAKNLRGLSNIEGLKNVGIIYCDIPDLQKT